MERLLLPSSGMDIVTTNSRPILQRCRNLGVDGFWIMMVGRWLYNSWRQEYSRLAWSSVDCNHKVYKQGVLLKLYIMFITCWQAEVGRAWLILTPRQNVCSNRNQERLFAGLAVLQCVMSEHYESQGSVVCYHYGARQGLRYFEVRGQRKGWDSFLINTYELTGKTHWEFLLEHVSFALFVRDYQKATFF